MMECLSLGTDLVYLWLNTRCPGVAYLIVIFFVNSLLFYFSVVFSPKNLLLPGPAAEIALNQADQMLASCVRREHRARGEGSWR